MKKLLLSFAAIALSISSAQAGVAINSKNFPDENMLWAMQAIDDNDEEWGPPSTLTPVAKTSTNCTCRTLP